MMSCAALETWNHLILSYCCTEYGQRCGVALSGHITTVAMSRSSQQQQHCTVEQHCSGLHTLQVPW
jgi:hypothetical protein